MNSRNNSQAQLRYQQLEPMLQNLSSDESAAMIEQFLREFPESAQAQNDLGVLHYALGNKLQALGRYERAVKLAPENLTFRKNLASFYFVELGWTDDAIELYTELLREAPEDIDILGALALISKALNQTKEAESFLLRIINLQPWNQDARTLLAELQERQAPAPTNTPGTTATTQPASELDDLLAELQQSISSMTPPPEAVPPTLHAPADADLNANIASLEAGIIVNPTNALLHNDLGVLLFERGDVDLSLSHHELAHRFEPQNLQYVKNLAGICTTVPGNIDRAIELLTSALNTHPNDAELLAALGNVSLLVGRPDEALIFLQRILDLEPWNIEVRDIVLNLQQSDLKDFFLQN